MWSQISVGMAFPLDSQYFLPLSSHLWRKTCLKQLSTTLPTEFALAARNLQAGYLWWRIAQFTLPEQSDWCDNTPQFSYNYAPVLPVNVSKPYFSTQLQGVHEKFAVWGRDYFIGCQYWKEAGNISNYMDTEILNTPIIANLDLEAVDAHKVFQFGFSW